MKSISLIPCLVFFTALHAEPVDGEAMTERVLPSPESSSAAESSRTGEATSAASDAESKVVTKTLEGPAWLGFQVVRPDEIARAHLPDLPAGMGFVIRAVEEKGPAEQAGLKPMDVVWKYDDQFLVNEGQLAVLLARQKPGDVVRLSLFRGGKPMEVSLTIGAFPLNRPTTVGPSLETLVMADDNGLPTRIINFEDRIASLNLEEGRATLKRLSDGKGYELDIHTPSGETIFSGNLGLEGDLSPVPEPWKTRVRALRRGLDSVVAGRMDSVRPPRPRVMVPGRASEKRN